MESHEKKRCITITFRQSNQSTVQQEHVNAAWSTTRIESSDSSGIDLACQGVDSPRRGGIL